MSLHEMTITDSFIATICIAHHMVVAICKYEFMNNLFVCDLINPLREALEFYKLDRSAL